MWVANRGSMLPDKEGEGYNAGDLIIRLMRE